MTRLVLKLLLKASLPLALLLGTLSYGVYLRGGDPAAILRSVGSGIGDRLASLVGDTADDARRGATRIGGVLEGTQDPDLTTVFTWTDAQGVTHFATSRPDDVVVTSIQVDPNTNVLAPLSVSPPPPESMSGGTGMDRNAGVAATGTPATAMPTTGSPAAATPAERHPGVAGMLGAGGDTAVSPRDAKRLLRLLQGGDASAR